MDNPFTDENTRKLRDSEVKRLARLKEWPHNYDGNDWGVLLSDKIKHYAERFELISPFDEELLRPAGYDLRVGSNYSIHGERKALNDGMQFEIGPYQVAVIETYETLNLPTFLIARWNIRVTHAYNGLLWVGGAQVDPGFRGRLCCPIYNLSTEPVRLCFKDKLAMIDFVTTTHFNNTCKRFPWQDRKMLVFPEYKLISSGIEKRVDDFQEQIRQNRETVSNEIKDIEKQTTRSSQEIGARIDTFVVLIFTVVAVLFAGLGVVATKSSESSLVVASLSLVIIAALALYFALRPYYLMAKLSKILPTQTSNESIRQVNSLLKLGWMEIVLGIVLVSASFVIDAWSVYKIRGDISAARIAQETGNQAIHDAANNKLELRAEVQKLHDQYDSKIANLERQVDALTPTKKKHD